jgi:hypothetical protein
MCGAPHSGLSRLIVRIKSRMSAGTAGLPTRRRDFQRQYLLAEKCHLGFATRTRSEQSDEQSAEQLRQVDHPEARITHRGICASPDTIFGCHRRVNARGGLR